MAKDTYSHIYDKKKTIYADAPKNISMAIASGEIITDFLPPPEKLVRKEPKVKITISSNTQSLKTGK